MLSLTSIRQNDRPDQASRLDSLAHRPIHPPQYPLYHWNPVYSRPGLYLSRSLPVFDYAGRMSSEPPNACHFSTVSLVCPNQVEPKYGRRRVRQSRWCMTLWLSQDLNAGARSVLSLLCYWIEPRGPRTPSRRHDPLSKSKWRSPEPHMQKKATRSLLPVDLARTRIGPHGVYEWKHFCLRFSQAPHPQKSHIR